MVVVVKPREGSSNLNPISHKIQNFFVQFHDCTSISFWFKMTRELNAIEIDATEPTMASRSRKTTCQKGT